jgi:folate-binding protein YgfZ
MSQTHIAILADRGVIAVSGEDAQRFLDNLITNDVHLLEAQPAIHSALLAPQGKILFDFMVVRRPDGYLLETGRTVAADLLKRLALYRLRAKVVLNDITASRTVIAAWGGEPPEVPLAVTYPDPRAAGLGHRLIMAPEMAQKLAGEDEGAAAYDRHRIAHGVPEAGRDYILGDTFPHEANFDRLAGVSFAKGCFVGQEVVARMQHKTVVRKRIVHVTAEAPLSEGADISAGSAVIGRIGSVDGRNALAMLRVDRALEARTKNLPLTSQGTPLVADPAALDSYAAAAEARASAGA